MSFYQPSLSLYDVLDALTNKANVRGDYDGDLYGTRVPQRRREPYNGRRQRYQPERSYYSIPNAPYYQPFYYSREEEQPSEQSVFPHYHRYNPNIRRRPSSTSERVGDPTPSSASGDNLVEALLNALVGDSSGLYSNEPEYQERENEDEKKEQETAKAIKDAILDRLRGNSSELGGLEEEAHDSVKDAKTNDQESDYDDEYNEDYNMQNEEEDKVEKGEKEKTTADSKEKKNSSSEEKSVFRSPVPAPLQVSNPQISLDLPFSPDVNVYDTDENYLVLLALPGANSKEFKIDFHPSSHELQIKGTIENKTGIDEKFIKISEIKYGDFERTVKFPVLPRIKDEDIKASYCNGLLQIKVPKVPQDSTNPQPKKRILIEDVPDEELVFESSEHNL